MTTPLSTPSVTPDSPDEQLDAGFIDVDLRSKAYGSGPSVLGNLRFRVRRREFVSVLAPSGAGKTTLLRLIAGLDRDYLGDIHVSGRPVTGPGLDRGVVFQESRLLPWLSAEANIAFALPDATPAKERAERTTNILHVVSCYESRHLLPHQLSGGMERRVALARALVNIPTILLLDEPLSALDMSMRHALQDEIAAVHAREQLTSVLVTHDVDEALFLSDRIFILSGSPARITNELPVAFPRDRKCPDNASERRAVLDAIMRY